MAKEYIPQIKCDICQHIIDDEENNYGITIRNAIEIDDKNFIYISYMQTECGEDIDVCETCHTKAIEYIYTKL